MLAGVPGAAAPEPAWEQPAPAGPIYRWVCGPLLMVSTWEPASSPLT